VVAIVLLHALGDWYEAAFFRGCQKLELSMQNKTMGVPAGRPLISSFRSGMSLSTFSRVIFHPPLAMLYELAPRDAAALERARALDPPTKTMFSMQLLRTAGYIAGLFELRERFGSGSNPASNFSFSSAIKRSKYFFSSA
jgi:hypothetical protein